MSDKFDPLNVIDHLTRPEKFGTQTRLAAVVGVKQNTISDRRKKNALTHKQMRDLLAAAPEAGVAVDPYDFFPEVERPSHGEAAA